MAITHYSYDKITIDGEKFDMDLIISPSGDVSSWAFDRVTHRITPVDFQDLVTEEVKTIIIGTGYNGDGYLDAEAKALTKELQGKGVAVHILPTSKAVNLFNATPKQGLLTLLHIRY
ncbi:MAG: MTH938/NDUFAF3 family protein [Magnetovibrionaceae bacterium]